MGLQLQATSLTRTNLLYELNHLTINQQIVLHTVFDKAKPFDLQYTMTAIAWEESDFSKYQLNLNDPSCGVFHIMPRNLADTNWEQSRICERLINDFDFSFSTALATFKWWYNYHKSKGHSNPWRKAISSYNGGYRGNKRYLQRILLRIHVLQIYLKE